MAFDPLLDTVALPRLNEAELAEVAPFGELCTFAENDPLVSAGDYPFNSYVILSGKVRGVDIRRARAGCLSATVQDSSDESI
jgi:hypothetical protein